MWLDLNGNWILRLTTENMEHDFKFSQTTGLPIGRWDRTDWHWLTGVFWLHTTKRKVGIGTTL